MHKCTKESDIKHIQWLQFLKSAEFVGVAWPGLILMKLKPHVPWSANQKQYPLFWRQWIYSWNLFLPSFTWLTVVCETKWSETKRNETKWSETKRNETKWKSVVCEMRICSLWNENLQFAKWQSVVCEMRICSLGNDNLLSRCVYSDILNRKFPPQKNRFAQKIQIARNATYKVFERRIATASKTSALLYALTPPHLYW